MGVFKFELGDYLVDIVTGFSGIVMVRGLDYYTGCKHYGVQDRTLLDSTGLPQERQYFDETRLSVDAARIEFNIDSPTSGVFPTPPQNG